MCVNSVVDDGRRGMYFILCMVYFRRDMDGWSRLIDNSTHGGHEALGVSQYSRRAAR